MFLCHVPLSCCSCVNDQKLPLPCVTIQHSTAVLPAPQIRFVEHARAHNIAILLSGGFCAVWSLQYTSGCMLDGYTSCP